MTTALGIHHVTAIAGDAQQNVGFYSGVLGLRLVKKTVNFDDPRTYHDPLQPPLAGLDHLVTDESP